MRLLRIAAIRFHDGVCICQRGRFRCRDEQDLSGSEDEVHDILSEDRPRINQNDIRKVTDSSKFGKKDITLSVIQRLRFFDARPSWNKVHAVWPMHKDVWKFDVIFQQIQQEFF